MLTGCNIALGTAKHKKSDANGSIIVGTASTLFPQKSIAFYKELLYHIISI